MANISATFSSEDREQALFLGRTHARIVLPIKWGVLAICIVFWMWERNWLPPSAEAFGLFFVAGMLLLAETAFFALDRITPRQVRPCVGLSFFFDLLFVFGLVVINAREIAPEEIFSLGNDFSILFVLMVLRGFLLFRTRNESVLGVALVTAFFVAGTGVQMHHARLVDFQGVLLRLALIWTVLFLSFVILEIFNRQREEMLRARERLVRSDSLASLGELAAGVAHEINNPIGVISTYCEYLRKMPNLEYAEDIESIHREARRCEEIVQRMLSLANPKVGRFERLDVGALLSELVEFLRLDKKSPVAFLLEAEPSLPQVHGDAGQLKQALLNCLLNARQVLDGTGQAERQVRIDVARARGPRAPVRIRIEDNGPGIAAEDTARVFEPFFTRRAGGTGLGLSIARRILEAHEGTITISRREDNPGTRVEILLPMAGEEDG